LFRIVGFIVIICRAVVFRIIVLKKYIAFIVFIVSSRPRTSPSVVQEIVFDLYGD